MTRRQEYLQAMGVQVWQSRAGRAPVYDDVGMLAGVPECSPVPVEVDAPPESMDWESLEHSVVSCTRCPLHQGRIQAVFGVGNRAANWMFVGEAPGAAEDRQGIPFVGRAGKLLTSMLFALGLERDQVYIANVLKCRPPNNRDPMGKEVACCEPYLHRQVELIGPKVIVALGRFAAQSLLKSTQSIGKLRGQRFTYGNGIPLVVSYHPAYLLRNPLDKRKAWEDLCLARTLLQ